MAVTTYSIDRAEWTFCMEKDGRWLRRLPWARLRFGDDGEDEVYVVPLPPFGVGSMPDLSGGPVEPYRSGIEWMPFQAFPNENGAAARSGTDASGAFAIHFYGVGID